MTHSLTHDRTRLALQAVSSFSSDWTSTAQGAACVAKAAWPKTTVKTIFVTRGEEKPSDD